MAPIGDKECFVIAPIGEAGSEVRRRSDQILRHLIAPAVMRCGYAEPVRADTLPEAGMITTQVIQKILAVPLVVADLTGRNPNVYYELALRHAVRKPCVQIVAAGERLPFDVAGLRTIQVDHRDLDSIEDAREEMTRQVRALDGRTDVDSPVSTAVDLALSRSGRDLRESLLAGPRRAAPPLDREAPIHLLAWMGPWRIRTLQQAGFSTVGALQDVPLATLATVPGIGPRFAWKLKEELVRMASLAEAGTRFV